MSKAIRFLAVSGSSPLMFSNGSTAIAGGSADVITAFSSDGRVAELDLVTLADPRRALPSYDAVLLLAPERAGEGRLVSALSPLIGAVTVDRMRRANLMVDRDVAKETPARAGCWLDPAPCAQP